MASYKELTLKCRASFFFCINFQSIQNECVLTFTYIKGTVMQMKEISENLFPRTMNMLIIFQTIIFQRSTSVRLLQLHF